MVVSSNQSVPVRASAPVRTGRLPRSQIQCYCCYRYGHYRYECPSLRQPQEFGSGNDGRASSPSVDRFSYAASDNTGRRAMLNTEPSTAKQYSSLPHPADSIPSVRDGYFVGSSGKQSSEGNLN